MLLPTRDSVSMMDFNFIVPEFNTFLGNLWVTIINYPYKTNGLLVLCLFNYDLIFLTESRVFYILFVYVAAPLTLTLQIEDNSGQVAGNDLLP